MEKAVATARISALETMLSARTNTDGKALKGYQKNVEYLRAELTRLRAAGIVESSPTPFAAPSTAPKELPNVAP